MRKDDSSMMVMTGLVLAVIVGVFAERMSGDFGGPEAVAGQPADDRFVLRAGVPSVLDVLSNDGGLDGPIRIARAPACGEAVAEDNHIVYLGSAQCLGKIDLAYCVGFAPDCAQARVDLTLEAPPGRDSKVDLVALPPAPVVKPGPEFALVPTDRIEDAGLRAFTATVQRQASLHPVAAIRALLDAGRAGGSDAPVVVASLPQGLELRPHAPDARAAAALLRSHAPDVAEVDDPLDIGALDALTIAALPAGETLELTLPAQRTALVEDAAPVGEAMEIEQVAARYDAAVPQPFDCDIEAALSPAPGAHLTLTVTAPCLAGQAIVAESQGFEFLLDVSEEGGLVADLPVLALDTRITLTPLNGEATGFDLRADGSDVLQVERSLFRFDASMGVAIAAAEITPEGVSRVATHLNAVPHRDAFLAGHGYLRRYASTGGRVIEVYTLPLSRQVTASTVEMRLVRAGDGTCSGPILLDFLHLGEEREMVSANLPVTACATRAGYSLRNTVGPIRVAAR